MVYVTQDFNYENNLAPLHLNIEQVDDWDSHKINNEIPFLSWTKNEILIVSTQPFINGWLEAYKVNDQGRSLGLIHKDFIEYFAFRT